MINKSPTNLDKFPVPVTGQEIPKGWFARLVSFINSLVLHGDGQYLAVSHNMSGTTIKPTPALLQLASARGAAPSSGGGDGADGIEASVSGGTASITLTGGTGSVNLVGTGDVMISGNTTTGNIEINCTGGGGGGGGAVFPDLSSPIEDIIFDTPYTYSEPVWLIGSIGVDSSTSGNSVSCDILINGYSTGLFGWSGSTPSETMFVPINFLIPPNATFELSTLIGGAASDLHGVVTAYRCSGQTPLADYTVTRASGTTSGSLFYGLSQQGDNTVSVDSSLNGTPLDFEGASVL